MLEVIKNLSVIELIMGGLFVSLFVFQIIYPWISFRKLVFYNSKKQSQPILDTLPPISVIICAKNEAANLERFLPKILEQDHPNYQVVVVNDCSDDRSEEVLENLKQTYAHLYFTNVKSDPIYKHGKKLAISLGIKAAKHEHLVFTDADCYPESDQWLASMARNFTSQKEIVLGVSPYEPSNGLLGQVIGYETLSTAILYISSAMRNKTYMGLGRNMAYTKKLFFDNNGFSGHTHILSGDDDLFINKVATKSNVNIELSSESVIKSIPESNWTLWLKQKRRHMTTGKYYKKKHQSRFAFEGIMDFLFYMLFIVSITISSFPILIVSTFVLRMLNHSFIRLIACKKLHFEKSYFFSSLWLDIIVPFLRSYLLLMNFVKPQKQTWR